MADPGVDGSGLDGPALRGVDQLTAEAVCADGGYLGYADFGRRFLERAVTGERVGEALRAVAGKPFDTGPVGVGPGSLIKVRAVGRIGEPIVAPDSGRHVSFAITVPADLRLTVDLGFDRQHFDAQVAVRLTVTARPAAPLRIVLDVADVTSSDVDVHLHAVGVRASVVQLLGDVEGEIKRRAAEFVRAEIAKPQVQRARTIDVGRALDHLHLPR